MWNFISFDILSKYVNFKDLQEHFFCPSAGFHIIPRMGDVRLHATEHYLDDLGTLVALWYGPISAFWSQNTQTLDGP